MLRTSRTNPYKVEGGLDRVRHHLKGLDGLVAIGGEDTLGVAARLHAEEGAPVVGVPKTIDNDLSATDYTFGFDTAVSIVTEAIDRLHTTAESHDRVMVVEVMGRHAGWIAVHSGIAGGADAILIPELPVEIERCCELIERRHARGKDFSIVVVAEGYIPPGDNLPAAEVDQFGHPRLGGIGERVAREIEKRTGYETRVSALGHVQRGGSPTPSTASSRRASGASPPTSCTRSSSARWRACGASRSWRPPRERRHRAEDRPAGAVRPRGDLLRLREPFSASRAARRATAPADGRAEPGRARLDHQPCVLDRADPTAGLDHAARGELLAQHAHDVLGGSLGPDTGRGRRAIQACADDDASGEPERPVLEVAALEHRAHERAAAHRAGRARHARELVAHSLEVAVRERRERGDDLDVVGSVADGLGGSGGLRGLALAPVGVCDRRAHAHVGAVQPGARVGDPAGEDDDAGDVLALGQRAQLVDLRDQRVRAQQRRLERLRELAGAHLPTLPDGRSARRPPASPAGPSR